MPRRLKSKRGGKNQRSKHLVGIDNFECRTDGCSSWVYAPSDTKTILCWRCLAMRVPPPVEKKESNTAKSKLRAIRNAATTSGEITELPEFPKGWHRRKHFKIKVGKKTYYYVRGGEVKRADYLLEKRKQDTHVRKQGAHSGYGRGWHLRRRFDAPDGKTFAYGKEVKS